MKFEIFLILGVSLMVSHRATSLDLLSSLFWCGCNDWRKGVSSCRNGIEVVLKKFPQPTYDFGQTILESFNTQIDNLKTLTNSTSVILSSRSTNLLEALSLLANVGNTPEYLLSQLRRALPAKTTAYCKIVRNLTEAIGKLDDPINKAIRGVETSQLTCLKQFERRFLERKQDRSEKIDFKEMVKSARLTANTIAFIADTAVNVDDSVPFANKTYEAIVLLTFISNLQLVAVHGTNANMGSVLHSETTNISPFLQLCFEVLDQFVGDITKLISTASFDSVANIKDYLTAFVEIIYSYNNRLALLIGLFDGVNITRGEVNRNIAKLQNVRK